VDSSVGLDGRYRFSRNGPAELPLGAMGQWVSPDEFVLDLNTVANINRFYIRLKLIGDQLSATINEATGEVKDLVLSGRAAPATP
jgi:hypothetical protein